MGKYSGNLVRSFATDKDIKPQYPSPEHAGGGPGDVRPGLEARTVPVNDDYYGTEFPSYETVGGGFELWHPTDSHDSEGVTYPLYSDDQQIETIAEVHSDPNLQRGTVRSTYIQPLLQNHTEVYSDTFRESDAPLPLNQKVAEHGRSGWGLPSNYGDVAPRLGWIRQTTTSILRNQNKRQYVYGAQPLTQRDAGVGVSAAQRVQKESLGSDIAGWVQTLSAHKNQLPAVWRDPGLVDDSLMARENNQATIDSATYGDTVY